jgi:hypothetical protein
MAKSKIGYLGIAISVALTCSLAFALDEAPAPVQSPNGADVAPLSTTTVISDVPSSAASAAPAGTTKKTRGRSAGEKDAEGTEAPNRFNNTDIIIKSKYELNGQSLEVDTD